MLWTLIYHKKLWAIPDCGWILLQMTEAVLFDNDGVLVDTETLFFEVTRHAFGRMGWN